MFDKSILTFNYPFFILPLLVIVSVLKISVANPEILLASSNIHPQRLQSSSRLSSSSFHDSPLLRSRKRILPMTINHNNEPSSGQSIPLSPLPIIQNQDFITDRVKMNLECRSKSMQLNINFTEPFRGVVSIGKSSYPSYEQSQECALRGDGRRNYSLQIFHNRCLTRFDKKRGQFTNILFVRYHPTLETGGDYSKTLVCKFGLVDFSVN